MTADDDRSRFVRDVLAGFGASGAVLDELVAYTAHPFDLTGLDPAALPLPDSPQIEVWEEYARGAARHGVGVELSRWLVQLRFPVQAGISQTEAYRNATRRGVWLGDGSPGLALVDPEGLDLVIHPTLAGRIPVITCRSRDDFVALVRALSCRNEPEVVPPSMGACIVNGLVNWDRVARLRARLEQERGASFDEPAWAATLRDLAPQKALYQDRVILLSRQPYSGVPAEDLGLDDAAWQQRSVGIRREHECTHYFTLVALGSMRNHLFDELIADCAGLVRIDGRYDAALALRFLGLERFPEYRAGGRFENYLQSPPVGPAAATILRAIVVRAARTIERVTAGMDLTRSRACDRLVVALAACTLVDLASDTADARLAGALASSAAFN